MNPIERANQLKNEADFLLQALQIPQIFAPYGGITCNGSYLLDVMAYPDIDLYVPQMTIEQVIAAGGRLAASPLVTELVFKKSDDPTLPGGLYLKPRIAYGDWGRPWKMDIWSVEQRIIDAKMVDMRRFQARMTPELHERIITYKVSILNAQGRTPMYSGYFIYRAFIDEGLVDFEDITRYLREHGIEI